MNTQESRPASTPGPDAAPGGGGRPGEPAAEFFDRIRALGVVRPDEGRWAAGVSAGLARRWGLDPLLVRGLFVVAGIVSGIGLGVYGLLWLFLPHADGRIHAQQVLRGTVTSGFVGAVLFVLVDFPLSGGGWFGWNNGGWGFHPFGGLVSLVVIGFGVWWLVTRGHARSDGVGWSGRGGGEGPLRGVTFESGHPASSAPTPSAPVYGTPEAPGPVTGPEAGPVRYGLSGGPVPVPAPVLAGRTKPVDVHRPSHALTLTTVGMAALAAGGIMLADRLTGTIRTAPVVAAAVALGVVALGIVLSGIIGRRAGGLAPIAILLAIAAANGALWHDAVRGIDRNLSWAPLVPPTSAYQHQAGRAVLDLTAPGLSRTATTTSPVTVHASLDVGQLIVVVPSGTATEVDASVGVGNVRDDVDRPRGVDRGGPGLDETLRHGGTPVIVVEAKMAVGQIWVVPQGTKVDR